jgi:hypothetical protein
MFDCQTCFNREDDDPFLSFSLVDLQTSARNGCFTCSLLEEGIYHCLPDMKSSEKSVYRWKYRTDLTQSILIQLSLEEDVKYSIEFFALPGISINTLNTHVC